MRSPFLFCLFISFCVLFCWVSAENGFLDYASVKGKPYQVDYDKRAIKINGQRTLFLSGSVHPPRVSVGSWDGILKQAKANGLNMIQVYVFWNYHEPLEGTFTWEGNADLHKFIELCAENNLFVNLRIGPYVCAEWNYGGIPAWLGFKQGVQFRTYNQIWMDYMAAWMKLVINKTADLFASNGGPIVLAQIENEYDSGGDAQNLKYVSWCGELVEQFNTTIPWVMCNGDSAKNTINTCNDLDCTNFITSHGQSGRILIDQPALWTEAEGGFQVWGASPSNPTSYFWGRSAEDMSYSVAKWFARGGSHLNYYMYYGGNHYGPWNGNGIVTMYASDVNICPDGLPHEPKYSHLGKLHQLLAQYADVLVSNDAQLSNPIHLVWYDQSTHSFKNGSQQIAFAYEGSSKSLIFVENQAGIQILTQYKGVNLTVEPYSVTLLDEQMNVLFSTGKVEPAKTHRVTKSWVTSFDWKAWKEPLADSDTSKFPHFDTPTPREQLNSTYTVFRSDPVLSQSVFMWYEKDLQLPSSGTLKIQAPKSVSITAFVNGQMQSFAEDLSHDDESVLTYSLSLNPPANQQFRLSLLSENMGNNNMMGQKSTGKFKGITGSVIFVDKDKKKIDLTNSGWRNRPALIGELLAVYTSSGAAKVKWSDNWQTQVPVTWYQSQFKAPSQYDPTASALLAADGLNKGFAYINGINIGRYYTILMNDKSGRNTQRFYHIPWDWLKLGEVNTITLVDVLGAPDIGKVQLMTSSMVSSDSLSLSERKKIADSGILTCEL